MTMIKEYRKKIDEIDSQIISLLEKRENLVKKVRLIKLQQAIPLKDSQREEQVLKNAGKFKKVFIEILK
ncbi:chorismate mutase [Candidatus Woesearchaeota archaeon]|nr:chorismate mutase [Candidatus Woesearchaeota archaeon]